MRLFLTAMLSICVSASGQVSPQRIPRQRAEPTGSLEGTVRMESGVGLGGVRIHLQSPAGRVAEGMTSGDGVFLMTELLPGAYRVSITHGGFVSS